MPRLILSVVLLLAAVSCFRAEAQTAHTGDFIERSGTKLTLHGAPFRYSGPNIEWLGLEGYGPHDPMGPRYPSHFEIDDAFATAAEMGARVVRAQTMGDTVGCALCVEPEQGKFNEAAFQASDYALVAAKRNGIRIIITLMGDCATCSLGGIGQYLAWSGKKNPQDFFTDTGLIAAYEKHIDAEFAGQTCSPAAGRAFQTVRCGLHSANIYRNRLDRARRYHYGQHSIRSHRVGWHLQFARRDYLGQHEGCDQQLCGRDRQ